MFDVFKSSSLKTALPPHLTAFRRVDVPKMRKLAQEFFHQERQRLLGLEDGYLDGYGDIDYEAQGGSGREHCTASSSEGSCQPHPRDPYASPSAGQYSRGDMGYEDVEIGGTGQDHGGHVGGSNGQGGHGSHYHQRGHDEDRRGLSDRQLQDQLARLLGGDEVQMPRDDPLVVLTLTGGGSGAWRSMQYGRKDSRTK